MTQDFKLVIDVSRNRWHSV